MHCFDLQIAPTSQAAQQQSTEVGDYAKALEQLDKLKEERDSVHQRVTLMEQVLTMAAVNQFTNFTITPMLVNAMMEEAAKLRKELEGIVRVLKLPLHNSDTHP